MDVMMKMSPNIVIVGYDKVREHFNIEGFSRVRLEINQERRLPQIISSLDDGRMHPNPF
jgi:hypothetical protein